MPVLPPELTHRQASATLQQLLAALAAVPVLNEPLTPALIVGLVAVSVGALQPWRLLRRA